jgi:hypothetical protein
MVIGDRPLVVNTTLTLAVELPELEGVRPSRIIFPARVVWCEQDISPDYFNIGFEFSQVKPEQKQIVQAIIRKYEFQRDMPNYPIKPSANPKG